MTIDRPITIALTLFIILLLVFFLVMPEYKTFGALQTELGVKKAEFNAEFDYYAQITKTYYDLQSRQDDIKKIDDALPSLPQDPTLGKILYFLQNTAKGSGLIMKNLFLSQSSPGAAASNSSSSSIRETSFSIDALGDYLAMQNFMASLEKSSRIFEITSISFSSQSGPPYSFSLQIKTHSY